MKQSEVEKHLDKAVRLTLSDGSTVKGDLICVGESDLEDEDYIEADICESEFLVTAVPIEEIVEIEEVREIV